MYKLENQVCTLEQAKKFDKYGLKLESYFEWDVFDWKQEDRPDELTVTLIKSGMLKGDRSTYYPAYSCAELGVLLPTSFYIGAVPYYLRNYKIENDRFFSRYENLSWDENKGYLSFKTRHLGNLFHEAHVKADLLLQLLKEKIINPKDLKLEDK